VSIPAQYGDGRSARRHAVTLFRAGENLRIVGAHVDASHPLASIRLTEPFAHAATIAYFDDGPYCEVAGEHTTALAAMLGQRASPVVRAQRRWPLAVGAIAALVVAVAAGAIWGLPVAAEAVTAMLPRAADQNIGALTRDAFAARGLTGPSTLDAAQQDAINHIWRSVQPARPRIPMALLVRAMPPPFGPNALALPDGTVILNDAMVRKILGNAATFDASQSAALAGVLAHEIGHIEGRHSMRSLVRASLTTAAAAYLFGDFSAVAAGAPAILLGASHSRAMETAADDYALAALQARHLPLAPLANLFDSMEARKSARQPAWFGIATGYLSSHPGSTERAARLRAADHH
jgi:Zn-dependent protease with chaperone function